MTWAILAASAVAAVAAVGGLGYQFYARRPRFVVVGDSTTPTSVNVNIRNVGATAARRVSAKIQVEGAWYDAAQKPPVLLADQGQSFNFVVPNGLGKDLSTAVAAVSYDGALGRRWTRHAMVSVSG